MSLELSMRVNLLAMPSALLTDIWFQPGNSIKSFSPELLEEHNTRNYDLFLGERKIATKSKIIGTF